MTYRRRNKHKGSKKRTGRGGLARKVAKLTRMVKADTPETKYADFNTSANISWSGSVTNILASVNAGSGIPQNDTASGHAGNYIRLKRYYMKCGVIGNSVSTSQYQNIRIIVFQGISEGTSSPGVNPYLVGDILTAASLGTNQSYLAQYEWQDTRRYRILYDRNHVVNAGYQGTGVAQTQNPGYSPIHNFNITIRPAKKATKFFGTSSTVIEDHGLYLIVLSDVPTSGPIFQMTSRVYYTDV